MKKKKMILAAVVLLLVFIIGGAVAYFTDTDTVTNTFTIGNVDISLSEPNWVAANGQNLMPGEVVAKDPKLTNDSVTNAAYVFLEVDVPCTTGATPAELFTYTVNSGWTELSTAAVSCTSGGNATHVYYYGASNTLTELAAGDNTTALFNNVTLLSTLTGNEGLNGNKDIVVTGYGIQTNGLASTTPTDVWGYFA